MTVASPLARQYYFMWLFFPITVLIHRAAYDPRPAVRAGTWAVLGAAAVLLCLSLPVFPDALQAYGNNLAAHGRACRRTGLAYPASAAGGPLCRPTCRPTCLLHQPGYKLI